MFISTATTVVCMHTLYNCTVLPMAALATIYNNGYCKPSMSAMSIELYLGLALALGLGLGSRPLTCNVGQVYYDAQSAKKWRKIRQHDRLKLKLKK